MIMVTGWRRFTSDHPGPTTAAIALLMFVAAGPGSRLAPGNATRPSAAWPAVLLAAISCVALLWHERRPRTVVTVAAVCTASMALHGYLLSMLLIAPAMAALYWLADHTDRTTAVVFTGATATLLVSAALIGDPASYPLVLKTIGPTAWLILPAALGNTSRLRRAYLAAERARAEHAEHTREQEARRRVTDERTRIARELHDVVAHHITLANAQASTAAHLSTTRPEQAREILAGLTATTSAALRDLKATVGLLRADDSPHAPLEPAPGLARLPDLTAALGEAGLAVTIDVAGKARPLSPGVDLTAFRVAQEALTNVAKHAATSTARVQITYYRDILTMSVTNEGAPTGRPHPTRTGADQEEAGGSRGPAASRGIPGGFGLIGMRERARSVGGELTAGPRPEGGFEVAMCVPLPPTSVTKTGIDDDPRTARR
ncbi:sensor histidine kinase [Frankia sp. AgB1.9]|uniref:sensor histidine kinase n=1 Tax=unclassified Frankia TaxID=2632575 RepID=UPI001931A43F|nr:MULTISPECIES: sensor histidine kinase [unclassified Frankia]MBL7489617.1 sensor histidine kinase [Frankia sp. AgW1.1]MBL7547324.1 sensor histidine kinase [Frankia sp. AgB1.9]MBL7618723.1 sensor histidine kinase [Frankia sp. AgB1.8]